MTDRVEQGPAPPNQTANPGDCAVSRAEKRAGMLLALMVLFGTMTTIVCAIRPGDLVTKQPAAAPAMMEVARTSEEVGPDMNPQLVELDGAEWNLPDDSTELGVSHLRETLNAVKSAATVVQPVMDDFGISDHKTGPRRTFPLGGYNSARRRTRWWIEFVVDGTLSDYAACLDQFEIELGALDRNGEISYASGFAAPIPTRRATSRYGASELTFGWRDGNLQQYDQILLQRAGIDTKGKYIFHIYPVQTEQLLAFLEIDFLNSAAPPSRRDIRLVRRTHFGLRKGATNKFEFYVTFQTYLGSL